MRPVIARLSDRRYKTIVRPLLYIDNLAPAHRNAGPIACVPGCRCLRQMTANDALYTGYAAAW